MSSPNGTRITPQDNQHGSIIDVAGNVWTAMIVKGQHPTQEKFVIPIVNGRPVNPNHGYGIEMRACGGRCYLLNPGGFNYALGPANRIFVGGINLCEDSISSHTPEATKII